MHRTSRSFNESINFQIFCATAFQLCIRMSFPKSNESFSSNSSGSLPTTDERACIERKEQEFAEQTNNDNASNKHQRLMDKKENPVPDFIPVKSSEQPMEPIDARNLSNRLAIAYAACGIPYLHLPDHVDQFQASTSSICNGPYKYNSLQRKSTSNGRRSGPKVSNRTIYQYRFVENGTKSLEESNGYVLNQSIICYI